MSPDRGGYPCPVTWCDETFVVPSLRDQHVHEMHPEETQP